MQPEALLSTFISWVKADSRGGKEGRRWEGKRDGGEEEKNRKERGREGGGGKEGNQPGFLVVQPGAPLPTFLSSVKADSQEKKEGR